MPRMFASDPGCRGATVGRTGNRYDADRRGFIHVDNPKDEARLREAGYVQAGNVPATSRRWVCAGCGWEAIINHCPKCDRADLERVEG